MLRSIDDIKSASVELGYKVNKEYDAIFISKDGIDYGLIFYKLDNAIFFRRVRIYNTEVLNLGFEIIDMKVARSPVRRVMLGNTTPLFFLSLAIPEIQIPSDNKSFTKWLGEFHTRLVGMAGNIDILYEEALKLREVVIRERRRYQSYIFEILAHISILKGNYVDALRFCEEYYEIKEIDYELGAMIMRDTINYVKNILKS